MSDPTFKPFRREIFMHGRYEHAEVTDWRIVEVENPLGFPARQGIRGTARRDNGEVIYIHDALGTICQAESFHGHGHTIDEEAFFAGKWRY